MARIRTIKPEFFTSLTIADLSPEQRLTFIGLWTHVDDQGRCVDDARLVKAAVWPLDDRTAADVEGDLAAINTRGLIVRYTVEGRRFMAVTGWAEHQKINRPSKSKFPAPSAGQVVPPPPPGSLNPHGGLTEPSNRPVPGPGEGSPGAHAAGSDAGTGPDQPENAAAQGPGAPDDAPTSANTTVDDGALNPHGALTEDSRQERNREQGTGKGITPPPSAGPPKGGRTDRGTRIPDDFAVTDGMAAWARENTPLCGRPDHDAFVDYWRAVPGAKGRKKDWEATWRNWMRREHERRSRTAHLADRPATGATVVPLNPAHRQQLTGTDARVAGWAALANELHEQENR